MVYSLNRTAFIFLVASCLQLVVGCDSVGDSDRSDDSPNSVASADPSSVMIGEEVLLDGSSSTHPEGDTLSYLWELSSPSQSDASLDTTTQVKTNFVPDVGGDYRATLTVTDEEGNSDKDSVTVNVDEGGTAEIRTTAATNKLSSLSDAEGEDDLTEAIVTLEEVAVVKDTSGGGSGYSVLGESLFRVDLKRLQAGLDTLVGETELPSGEYGYLRIKPKEEVELTFSDGSETEALLATGVDDDLYLQYDSFSVDSSSDRIEIEFIWDVDETIELNQRGNIVFVPVINASVSIIEDG